MSDEDQIMGIFTRYVETWRKHDMDAWGALFTDDADVVSNDGGWATSNQEHVAGHKAIPDTVVSQMANYSLETARINFLTPDIALVHAIWEWPGFIQHMGRRLSTARGSSRWS
ncbi:MAG: SgcJ/EcaC family oxidoreductase [Thermomicrobiales bacterium]